MSGVAPNWYDTNTLIAVVQNLKLSQNWLLDRFFPNIVTSDTEFVSIDVDVGKRRMSPFVSPLVEGKLVEQRRYQTNIFKPAYIKDKRAPDLLKPVRRMIGERIGGVMSNQERAMANLEFELTDQIDMLNRRLEWMAAQALMFGTVTIAGDGFPTTVVDFGRAAANTVVLTGNNRWGFANNADPQGYDPVPTQNIETWQSAILKSSGVAPTDIVFTTTPWQRFLRAEGVQGAVVYPRFADSGNDINPGSQIIKGAILKGRWGQYNLWLYNDWYVDDNNVEQPMLPDGTVLLGGPGIMGTRAFGAVIDPEFNYAAMAYAPKTWIKQDPAQRLIMMQSSPIVIPSRVNASFAATVI